jgi:hypothetical protein
VEKAGERHLAEYIENNTAPSGGKKANKPFDKLVCRKWSL